MITPLAASRLVERLARLKVIPVVTIDDPAQAEPLGRVLVAAGLPCVEITFRTAAAAEAVGNAKRVDGLLVGAGTLLGVYGVVAAIAAGADFGVAPCLDEEVDGACREHGLPFFPGVATPSEVGRARRLGRVVVKLFPAGDLGGPLYIRSLAPVFDDVRFIPTGGVTAATAAAYLALPSVLAVGGSWVASRDALRAGDLDAVRRHAEEAARL